MKRYGFDGSGFDEYEDGEYVLHAAHAADRAQLVALVERAAVELAAARDAAMQPIGDGPPLDQALNYRLVVLTRAAARIATDLGAVVERARERKPDA